MSQTEQTFIAALKAAGYSVTSARKAVFSALSSADSITMRELTQHLENSVDRASVYRAVDLFQQLGIIQRVQIGWKYRLELSDQFNPHHHHIHCAQCGRVLSIPADEALENHIHQLAAKSGFSLQSHQLELSGICETCKPHKTA